MSEAAADTRELLKRALLEIRSLKGRLATLQQEIRPPVAVTGMACRFPGGADDPAAFWRLLVEGRDAVGPLPPGRAADGGPPLGGFLDDVESFDAACFEITPREAQAMDPQHRLLLETVWQALADAAIEPRSLSGSRTGVFVGLATNDFARRSLSSGVDRFYGSGTSPAVAAGRIAYALDLKGPCLTLDTACSSSLTAAHLAVRALRASECDLALVGGVSLMLSGELSQSFAEAGMLAPDGRCKSFDAAANGYGRAEGVGVVVLRRLADAEAQQDRIHAVIRGSAVNQDGRSAGLTAPNGPAQVAVIQAALADADLAPDAIDFVEAHGSGTPLGDVIEAQALATVFAGRTRPLLVGTVKSTIGHAEAAAGIAGLIKAVLALRNDTAPPNLHFRRLNPEIRPGSLDLVVPTEPRPGITRVGVSSFGFSGSNAHLVLERAPPAMGTARPKLPPPVFRRQRFPLPGSAPATRTLAPSDPLLAGTGGLAHLGVLLHLLQPARQFAAIRFEQALQVDQPREIRLRPADGATHLESRALGAAAWTTHLSARPAPPAALQPPRLPDRLATPVPADDLYAVIEAAGFAYGAQARCLVSIQLQDDLALGTLAPGLTLADPGVVEAGAQLLYALVADAGQRPPMLGSCASLACADPAAPASRVWLRLREQIPGGPVTADFGVLAADGTPLAEVGQARFARRPSFLQRFGHDLVWDRIPAPATGVAPSLVLGGSGLPWATASTIDQAVERLRSLADPLLLVVAEQAEPLAAATWLASLVRALGTTPCRLVLATRGAVATGHGVEWPASPGGAAIWGMTQALVGEQPGRRCRLVDLDPGRPLSAQADVLALECAAAEPRETAWRNGQRLARSLRRALAAPAGPPARAVLRQGGSPPEIAWEALPPAGPIPAGHVAIEVVAAGLNFRDRLVALGLRPADLPLGADLAGIVRGLGAGVADFRPGDLVVALAQPALADLVVVPAGLVRQAPLADPVAAATMPLAYATARAALGREAAEGPVLVHQAAGATGLAAVELARAACREVLATASPAKQAFLAALGITAIADSRTPAAWPALGPAALAIGAFGPELASTLDAGHVVDLTGQGEAGFDLDALPAAQRAAALDGLDRLPPLPVRAVDRTGLAPALAAVGEGIGRTVVLLREPPRVRIDPDGAYLVTGAAGALGHRISRWLSDQGAARILMLDRVQAEPVPRGTMVVQDIADEAAMRSLLDRTERDGPLLRGIFHAAALADEGPLEALGPERIAAILDAKVTGAEILHRLTLDRRARPRRLDHFVLLSSVVSLLPSASQGAYAAANAVLDSLAHRRRALGLAGLSLNLGPVAAGIGDRMGERAHQVWQRHGIGRLDPDALVAALPELLATPWPQRAVLDIDWDVYGQDGEPRPEPAPASLDLAGLQAILAPIVGAARPDSLDPDTPLLSLGIDSLMAVEFAQAIGRALGRPVPRTFVYSHPNLRAAATALASPRPAPAAKAAPAEASAGALAVMAPAWVPAEDDPAWADGWQVLGEGPLATRLRQALSPGDELVDLRLLDEPARDGPQARRILLERFAQLLRASLGRPARLAWACREDDPLAPLLDGLIATARVEYPDLRLQRIVLAPDLADPAAAILAELGQEPLEPLVLRHRDGRRVRRFQPAAPRPSRPIRADGAYLVTGGTGGIGRLLARDLLDRGAGRVVLASRRGILPDDPILSDSCLADPRLGVRACDLADAAAVERLVRELADGPLPLRGVFHLAGVTADGLLATQDVAAMAPAFAAKVDGARLLDQATRGVALDHFVLFGSLTAIIGLAGAGAYAAANAMLPPIARERQEAGLPGIAIDWGAWQGVGMAEAGAAWRDGHLPVHPASLALAALHDCLQVAPSHVAILPRGETGTVTLPEARFRSTERVENPHRRSSPVY
ncbi:SDR family NAD(P)-dependent oxidoreductase [Geminicoccus roseus]|uniref:SDR family NAD(P)-dependent oxidoreductase n=1 Tax=Geminicoccus roseus TaxID=404900 RepID=UPI0003F941E1|nr:SDR family NAD(P)-dependent oxidoreductase [Geminicoccus roseus]